MQCRRERLTPELLSSGCPKKVSMPEQNRARGQACLYTRLAGTCGRGLGRKGLGVGHHVQRQPSAGKMMTRSDCDSDSHVKIGNQTPRLLHLAPFGSATRAPTLASKFPHRLRELTTTPISTRTHSQWHVDPPVATATVSTSILRFGPPADATCRQEQALPQEQVQPRCT